LEGGKTKIHGREEMCGVSWPPKVERVERRREWWGGTRLGGKGERFELGGGSRLVPWGGKKVKSHQKRGRWVERWD